MITNMVRTQVMNRIVALWSMPRSRSTAFFRMMAERGDFQVLHEPFSNLAEFGRVRVGDRKVRSMAVLPGAIRALAATGPVFFKDTTDARYPALLADQQFLASDAVHTFLIRHPRQTIASYYMLNQHVRCDQIGVEALHEIYTRVAALTSIRPVLLDADDLVRDPSAMVQAYCDRLGCAYLPRALSWSPGHRNEWQATQGWHADVAASSGFSDGSSRHCVDVDSHPVLSGYLRYHLPFYHQLYEHRLAPGA
jgi:hypothetical protein